MDIALGDGLTLGYDGQKTLRPYSKRLWKLLDEPILNWGQMHSTITGQAKKDLTSQVHTKDYANYNTVFLFYGDCDYQDSTDNLAQIAKSLRSNINKLRQDNPQMEIFFILPLNQFNAKGKSLMNVRGKAGYSIHQLMEMLNLVCQGMNVPVININTMGAPIITSMNHQKQYADHERYPTQKTYDLIAERVASFVKEYRKGHRNNYMKF